MKKTLLIALTLIPLMSLAQNRVQNYIDQRMKTDSLLINAVVGILAVDSQGREIAAWNPDMPLLTASTMKTITTGLGYEVLGPGYRFSTRVAYDGRIENGVLHGNLYIVGGADPTLGSRDTIAFPIDSIFGIWADAVK
ncbi:MAG: D-alanyl-D-alanine carboxypeptidase, partial [Bacteroidales bacterium]|nr:D-alanyl-D-alanine carboxypeptidase [Bacteroidales bacterium]